MKYDVSNPTPGRRVIYDGIKDSMKMITIEPGEVKYNVALSEFIAEELRARVARDGAERKTELVVVDASGKEDEPKVEDTRTPARVKADALVANADGMDFPEWKSQARDVLGDAWPGGNPSKADVLALLVAVK